LVIGAWGVKERFSSPPGRAGFSQKRAFALIEVQGLGRKLA
jgi:hypothetical protein